MSCSTVKVGSLEILATEQCALLSVPLCIFLVLLQYRVSVLSQCFSQLAVTLQSIRMRLFDELYRCVSATTWTNIYSDDRKVERRKKGSGGCENIICVLFTVYGSRNLVFLWVCMCECHLLRQSWICPEIIHDLDEGQRERSRGKTHKERTLKNNKNMTKVKEVSEIQKADR